MEPLESIFVCPTCKGQFAREQQALVCRSCREEYPIVADIPILVPKAQYPQYTPDPGTPFLEAMETARYLAKVEGNFDKLVDEYYEGLRGTCGDANLFEYYRNITKSRRVGKVSEEVGMISLAMDLLGCKFPMVHRAVEFGSGWGFSLAALAASRKQSPLLANAMLCGFDLNPSILVVAQRLFRDLGLDNVHLAVADVRLPMPFPAKSIDLIYSNGVVEHVIEQDVLMKNLSETLSPDSVLHFLIPNRYMIHPEPHFNVRGVGFVPRKYQKKYVGWRLGCPEAAVCEILSYSPSDLASLMGNHFPNELLAAIPMPSHADGRLKRTLTRLMLGLMAMNSYHCIVRRTRQSTPSDARRGKLCLSTSPRGGRQLSVARTLAPAPRKKEAAA